MLTHGVNRDVSAIQKVCDEEALSVSSSKCITNRIQQYNTVRVTNITNSKVVIDFVMFFCWGHMRSISTSMQFFTVF